MLFCNWCDRRFFDGETILLRDCNGTEIPYHSDCLAAYVANERTLAEMFDEAEPEPVTVERRRFRDAQFQIN